MKQINNGYLPIYYLKKDGTIYNTASGKIMKPNNKHSFYLKTVDGKLKTVSLKTIYREVFNLPFCEDKIKDLEGEQWKVISGTAGAYWVSNLGRVKSYQGYEAIIMKPRIENGYERLDIVYPTGRASKMVHVLVANEFLPMPPTMEYQLHHKNYKAQDNRADNLIYMLKWEHVKLHAEERRRKNGKESSKLENNHSQ